MSTLPTHAILDFWFGPPDGPGRDDFKKFWFTVDPAFDEAIHNHFGSAAATARTGVWDGARITAEGSLALILLLDQFPRNLYRGTPKAFASDAKARGIAREMVLRGLDQALPKMQRLFAYLPFEHSESLADQDLSVRLIGSLGDTMLTDYAQRHRVPIARFGRFPHRNAVLGRQSTDEEIAYLTEHPDGF